MKGALNAVDETDLIHPKDPSVSDDLWPEFVLSNVDIYNPKRNNEPTNLFEADTDCPLTLIGRLDRVPRELQSLIFNKATLPSTIRICNVEYFAFGQREDGGGAIWAAGEAGWYLIRPSRTYKEIYTSMAEAIEALYFATDFYLARKGKRSMEQHAVREIFREFLQDPAHACTDIEMAERTFLRHRHFLLGNMQKAPKRNDIRWKKTPLFNFLAQYESDEEDDNDQDEPMGGMDGAGDEKNFDMSDDMVGRGKSSLRPRSGKFSIKAAGRRRSFSELDEEDSVQRPSSKRKKGTARILRSSRRINSRNETSDDAMITTTQDEDEPAPDTVDPPDEVPLPIGRRRRANGAQGSDKVKLEIVEEPLPTCEANSPGDVWRCPLDGCSHVVYAASTERAQQFIRDHYQSHAYQSQAQIDLIYKEERPYLPVSNLIKRIRDIAAAQPPPSVPEASSANFQERPTPIRQRY